MVAYETVVYQHPNDGAIDSILGGCLYALLRASALHWMREVD